MNNIIPASVVLVISLAVTLFFDFAGLAVMLILTLVLFAMKKIDKKIVYTIIATYIIFMFLFYLYLAPGFSIAKGQGTVLSDNWFQALTWMKENTPECTVVATYWDPGHFITGIARRAVIFDGASQSDLFTRPATYETEGVVVEQHDANINHIIMYSGGNKTTARIQDASTTLLTSNETLAIEILKEYRKPGCDSMYYIASADLLGKSTWWTYFSTWNPVDKKGTPYVYSTIPLGSAKPDLRQNAIVYTYPMSQAESFILYEPKNSSPIVFLQQQGRPDPIRVEKFVYFTPDGVGRLIQQDDAQIRGTAWVEPGNRAILFIPPELENALFTRMFLYNGQGLEKFEFVNNWGGEVKLFRVKFD